MQKANSKKNRFYSSSRAPQVAVWVKPSENSTYFPLPWYLKNKTTVSSIEIDNSILYCQNDEDFQEEDCKPTQSVTKIEQITISINGENSSESSSDEEDSELAVSNSTCSVESVVVYGEVPDNFSRTLRDNSELPSEITLQMNHYLSTAANDSQR